MIRLNVQRHYAERGLDFEDAPIIFSGDTIDDPDERRDYGERRMITAGYLRGRMVNVVWTPRGAARHIISMRKTNEKEQAYYRQRFSQS